MARPGPKPASGDLLQTGGFKSGNQTMEKIP
jgi:hypothetical protein